MSEALPKWVMKAYSRLWNNFNTKEFDFNSAAKVLDDKLVSLSLSKLRKNGWVNARLDPKDSRKRIYSLIKPEDVVKDMK